MHFDIGQDAYFFVRNGGDCGGFVIAVSHDKSNA